MTLVEAIASVDMDDTIDRMNVYATGRLQSVRLKDFNGKEPIDFVGELLLKVIEGDRDWAKANCSFKEFLFGCLKSEISNFFKTCNSILDDDIPIGLQQNSMNNIEEQRAQAIELLKKEGGDDNELAVFECWIDGMTKPLDIAEDLKKTPAEVYAIIKRLERKLKKIRTQAKSVI